MAQNKHRDTPDRTWPLSVVSADRVGPLCLLLFLLVFGAFLPAVQNDFTNFDDPQYVTESPQVRSGLNRASVRWAFGINEHVGFWAPLMTLSHMLDVQMYGLRPWGHHLTSVLLHAINGVLVFLVLRKTTGATWRSLCVAALFALHPLRVESVAWVCERKDVLSTMFWMLALWAYARFAEEVGVPGGRSRRFYVLALGFFVLGLMSKPMLVTVPCVMLLLDYWPLKRWGKESARGLVAEKLPFFVLSALVSAVTLKAKADVEAVESLASLPLLARAENAVVSYARYLGATFWPVDLCVLYPHPGHWPLLTVLGCGLLLLAVSGVAVHQRGRRPYLAVGWFWYLGTLVPVIGLVQSGVQSMADRFTYVPSIGVLVLLTWGVCEWTQRCRRRALVLSLAAAALLTACLALTQRQIGIWADSETLFRHAISVTSNNYVAHCNLGEALTRKGRIDDAIREFEESLRIKPDFAYAHYNLGIVLGRKGRIDDAIGEYQAALRFRPNYAQAYHNLGATQGRLGRFDEAIRLLREALRIRPDYASAHANLGVALGHQGRLDEAIGHLQEAVRLDPDSAEARTNLRTVLEMKASSASSPPASPAP